MIEHYGDNRTGGVVSTRQVPDFIKFIYYDGNYTLMNALTVQNTRQKCDLGNKNDSVTGKKITADNI